MSGICVPKIDKLRFVVWTGQSCKILLNGFVWQLLWIKATTKLTAKVIAIFYLNTGKKSSIFA